MGLGPTLTITKELPDHLGGSAGDCHTDEGALDYVIQTFGIKSMYDVGCGEAGVVKMAREKGLAAFGIDGDHTCPKQVEDVLIHDYTVGPALNTWDGDGSELSDVDFVWSVEFLEHVDKRYIFNFMDTFQKGKYVLVTHALPGQPGDHHVNCNTAEYWVEIFRAFGFEIDVEHTNAIRAASTMTERYMRQQSLFFRNLNRE